MVFYNEWEAELSRLLQPSRDLFSVNIAMLPDAPMTIVTEMPQNINVLFPKATGSNGTKDGQEILEFVGIELNLQKRYKDLPAVNLVIPQLMRTLGGYKLAHSRSPLFFRDRSLFKPVKGLWKSELTFSFTWYLDYSHRQPSVEDPKVKKVTTNIEARIDQLYGQT